ncbi:Zn2 DNA-binding protein [Venustampulla echinocandica]|uniref:Zn2 DNA-binding protein n=1 Tax=Venustampulla echinocandica TaxID=2656787 RepID=A0A370TBM5_9HELO|nr:Zn2 DNA-binding protein [Venustampulla echinocandica]RDL31452.1 Zn2 DNA-binding protein [Venustampulla echinocandica]
MKRPADNHDDATASSTVVATSINSLVQDGMQPQILPNFNSSFIASSNSNANPSKPATQRHRASIACASCRERRIRCVVPAGGQECTQCKRSKTKCIIRNDDERRRPISKGYVSSLTDRIALLETMLKEAGREIPPANYPPKTRAEATASQNDSSSVPDQQYGHQNTTPRSTSDESMDGDNGCNKNENNIPNSILKVHPPPQIQASKKEGLVHMLLSTRGHLSFDQLSGRLRFFGPASNFHIYADSNPPPESRGTPEQLQRTQRAISSLSSETHDYLMDLFWEYYNSVLHIVHKEAFMEDMQNNNSKYYSSFLHICILAMGYRYADLRRGDMKMITLGNRECTLQREAKYMLDMELERPGGIPSVQAFLLLGDLECGVGRDNTGWMYAGIANRLCFDLGLHLLCKNGGLSEDDIHIRQMTLFACVVYDKYWALFLGRPTAIKSSDLEMYRLSKQFSCLSTCKPAGVQKSLETQIYEELLDLMELAGKIAEMRDSGPQDGRDTNKVNSAYLEVMDLDRQLQIWYRKLPDNLAWKPENIQTAPSSFFLLHQQYHCSLILLHRPWAKYENPTPSNSDDGNDDDTSINIQDNHSFMSRSICTRRAILVSRIFWHHRQRFDTRRIFITGIQHAGTAATALVAALAFIPNRSNRKINLQYLQCLASSLQDMSGAYQPAASMSSILQSVMLELQSANKTPPPDFRHLKQEDTIISARKGSNGNETKEERISKKRQFSKPSSISRSTRLGLAPKMTTTPEFVYTPATTPPSNMSVNTSGLPALHNHLVEEEDRCDGYAMLTPHSEGAVWPNINSDVNTLDYPMTYPETDMSRTQVGWVSGEGFDPIAPHNMDVGIRTGKTLEGPRGGQELDFFNF